MLNHAEHFIEKFRSLYLTSGKINLKVLADLTYPIKPKTFGQKLREKRMDLGLRMKQIAQFLGVTQDAIINWELRNVKPSKENLEKLKKCFQVIRGEYLTC